jgi:hypothetical protein
LHAILPELVEFRPEPLASLSYRVAGGAVLGAGLTQPHVFAVTLRGATVDRSRWMPQQPAEQVQRSNSHDLLDTDPPRTFVFAPDGSGIEELQGTITARETGLYSVRFVFHYSVAGQDMRHTSLPVHIYKQG